MTETMFDKASRDIDDNLWVLSPAARARIKSWFLGIESAAYKRGFAAAQAQQNQMADPPTSGQSGAGVITP